eukprot:TRINITY_DN37587_c0_g1_i1.p1 TRINITY_DN37587_c0_g1~~TRINITY_DN37587_c0_g1_i1.p1  ORF type:complete len:233 (+),score=34.18 TRINITY_DN37587_c0_g1_i1:176-874(+)
MRVTRSLQHVRALPGFAVAFVVLVAAARRFSTDLAQQIMLARKVVSALHAVACCVLCGAAAHASWRDLDKRLDPPQRRALRFSFSYFVFDSVVDVILAALGHADPIWAVHHAACVLGVGASLAFQRGSAACLGLFIAEISTPLYNLRWLMLTMGLADRYKQLYSRVSLGFVALFIAARMGLGSMLARDLIGSSNPNSVKIAGGGVWAVSVVWASMMIKQVGEHLTGGHSMVS